jgi:RimJ/RimL family protein N-acetyltransferase
MNSPEEITLRDVQESDLAVFFEHQSDPEANYMAAFTAKDPTDKAAFMAHWARILSDETTTNKTILLGTEVVGHVASFIQFGEREVSYWIGKQYWGRGLATQALTKFLAEFTVRPLYGRAVKDNVASIRVLEKCGFTIFGEDRGFANARGEEVEEYILKLEAANSQ